MAMWVRPMDGEAVGEGWGPGAIGSEFMFFLFNDLILYAVQKKKFPMRPKGGKVLYDYKGFFLLFNANVVDVPDGGGMSIFLPSFSLPFIPFTKNFPLSFY